MPIVSWLMYCWRECATPKSRANTLRWSPFGAAAAPSRAQRRLHELQQTAAQSLLRAVRMHTQAAHEQLDATDRAATHATGMARQGAEQMQSAISQIRSLTAELRAMREGTCLESLPPPRFGI